MDAKKLKTILKNHDKWVRGEKGGKKANLCGADLHGADLNGVDLCNADLRNANLFGADLCGANLCGANFYKANLQNAYFTNADLRGANLFGADLRGADLRGADLQHACLIKAENVPFIPMVPPESGSFIGWKKASNNKIVKLLIPEDAKRSSATTRKCRCDKAKVLAIETLNGRKSKIKKIASTYDRNFVYEIGKTVKVPNFCEDRWDECAAGIHFFVNRQEAVEY